MQKKLIALAVAGLVSGGAFAQSNVVISGRMSVGVESMSAGGATAGSAGNYTSRFRAVDNNSELKFAGEEALGGGTSAWWQITSAVGTTNNIGTSGGMYGAANTATVGTRNTAVGLKGGWGTAMVGKWDVHYNSMSRMDANGLAGGLAMNTNSLAMMNYINGTAIPGSGRDNNVLAYVSPDFNGFSVLVGYTTVGQADTPLLAKKDSGWQFNPRYSNGPIDVAYSYLAVNGIAVGANTASGGAAIAGAGVPVTGVAGSVTCTTLTAFGVPGTVTTVATAAACLAGGGYVTGTTAAVTASTGNGADVRSNRLGGAYSFPMGLKVGLIWDKSKITNNNPVAASTWAERTAWALPVSYTAGAHKVSFTYAKTNSTSLDGASGAARAAAFPGGYDDSAKQIMLGYEYSMSKRTTVGVAYTQINNSAQGGYDFWHASSNVTGTASGVNAGVDPRSFSLNLAHTF